MYKRDEKIAKGDRGQKLLIKYLCLPNYSTEVHFYLYLLHNVDNQI